MSDRSDLDFNVKYLDISNSFAAAMQNEGVPSEIIERVVQVVDDYVDANYDTTDDSPLAKIRGMLGIGTSSTEAKQVDVDYTPDRVDLLTPSYSSEPSSRSSGDSYESSSRSSGGGYSDSSGSSYEDSSRSSGGSFDIPDTSRSFGGGFDYSPSPSSPSPSVDSGGGKSAGSIPK